MNASAKRMLLMRSNNNRDRNGDYSRRDYPENRFRDDCAPSIRRIFGQNTGAVMANIMTADAYETNMTTDVTGRSRNQWD